MSTPSPVVTTGLVRTLPLTSPVSMPLKKGDDDDDDGYDRRSLRPTLSFRQKPEPPKMPSGVLDVGGGGEKPLRPTLSFRQKPEPPKFMSAAAAESDAHRELLKTKSKMDMLSTLIKQQERNGGSASFGTGRGGSSSDDDSSDDDEACLLVRSAGEF